MVNGVRDKTYWIANYSAGEINYLKRSYIELEGKNFENANNAAEDCLAINVENADAWWIKFLAEFSVTDENKLVNISSSGDLNKMESSFNFINARKFSHSGLKIFINQILSSIKSNIQKVNEISTNKSLAYDNYLIKELSKISIGERIIIANSKISYSYKSSAKIVLFLLSIIGIILSVVAADYALKWVDQLLVKETSFNLFFIFSLLGYVLTILFTIALSILSAFFGYMIHRRNVGYNESIALLTKDDYLNNKRPSSSIENLEKVRLYIAGHKNRKDFWKASSKNNK